MIPARLAAHVRRRRGLWIAAAVLAVAIVPYVTAFYTLRTRTMASFMHVGPSGNRYSTTHRLYHFEGGPHVTPALYYAFIPLHQWCLGGMTAEEFGALSPEQMRGGGAGRLFTGRVSINGEFEPEGGSPTCDEERSPYAR